MHYAGYFSLVKDGFLSTSLFLLGITLSLLPIKQQNFDMLSFEFLNETSLSGFRVRLLPLKWVISDSSFWAPVNSWMYVFK